MILKRKIYNKLLTLKKRAERQKAFLIESAGRIGKPAIYDKLANELVYANMVKLGYGYNNKFFYISYIGLC